MALILFGIAPLVICMIFGSAHVSAQISLHRRYARASLLVCQKVATTSGEFVQQRRVGGFGGFGRHTHDAGFQCATIRGAALQRVSKERRLERHPQSALLSQLHVRLPARFIRLDGHSILVCRSCRSRCSLAIQRQAAVCRFGSNLVIDHLTEPGAVFATFWSVIIGATRLGNVGG